MKNTREQNAHRKLIGQFLSDIASIGFRLTQREQAVLNKYGALMEALVCGQISPLTPEQERFVQVARWEVEALTEFEKTWMNVIKAREKNKNAPRTSQPDIYIPHPPSVQVCRSCGMVSSNCTCGRSWY